MKASRARIPWNFVVTCVSMFEVGECSWFFFFLSKHAVLKSSCFWSLFPIDAEGAVDVFE